MKRVNQIGTIYSLFINGINHQFTVDLFESRKNYLHLSHKWLCIICRSMVAYYIQFVHNHSHNNIIMILCRLPETNTSPFGAKVDSSERPTKNKG